MAAPDFFPAAGQRELTEANSPAVPESLRNLVWQVRPDPLSGLRLSANLQMPNNPLVFRD